MIGVLMFCVCFFKQKTAYDMRISDWRSDVCSSDLFFERAELMDTKVGQEEKADPAKVAVDGYVAMQKGEAGVVSGFMTKVQALFSRSEERRVGKEGASTCRAWWERGNSKKNRATTRYMLTRVNNTKQNY